MIILKKKDYYYNKTFILQGVIYKKLNNERTYLRYINKLIDSKFIYEISYDKDKSVEDISIDNISVPIISSILFYRHNVDLFYCEIEELIIRTKI